jgi:hypothetical protein
VDSRAKLILITLLMVRGGTVFEDVLETQSMNHYLPTKYDAPVLGIYATFAVPCTRVLRIKEISKEKRKKMLYHHSSKSKLLLLKG